MRMLLSILAACASATACAAAVALAPPVVEWADCEAATNAALPSATWQRRGPFDVRMSAGGGTALVQVAFGRDADGDGELSRAETVLVVGRGLGEAFVEDVAARVRYAEALPSVAGRRGLGLRVSLDRDGAPTGLVVTNEIGFAVFPEWRHAPPAFCFDTSWDMVRVVSAGPDDADGHMRVEIGPDGTLFIMR